MNPLFRFCTVAAPVLLASPVLAHPGHGPETAATDGFLHFIFSPDHMFWGLVGIAALFGVVALVKRATGRGPRA